MAKRVHVYDNIWIQLAKQTRAFLLDKNAPFIDPLPSRISNDLSSKSGKTKRPRARRAIPRKAGGEKAGEV